MLVREKILPSQIAFTSFTDLFSFLNTLNTTLNVVIDEYPYLKAFENAETVQAAKDEHKKRTGGQAYQCPIPAGVVPRAPDKL